MHTFPGKGQVTRGITSLPAARLFACSLVLATASLGVGCTGDEGSAVSPVDALPEGSSADYLGDGQDPSLCVVSPGNTPEETWQRLQSAFDDDQGDDGDQGDDDDQDGPCDVIDFEPGLYDIGAHKLVIDRSLTLRGPEPTALTRDEETGAVLSGEWGAKLTGEGAPLGTVLLGYGFDPILLVEVRLEDGETLTVENLELEFLHGYGLMHLGATPEVCYPENLEGCVQGGALVVSTCKLMSSSSNPAVWDNSPVFSGLGGDMSIRVEDSVLAFEATVVPAVNGNGLSLVGAYFDDVAIARNHLTTVGSINDHSNCMEVLYALGDGRIVIEDNVGENDIGACIVAIENEASFHIEGNSVAVRVPPVRLTFDKQASFPTMFGVSLGTSNPSGGTIANNRIHLDGGGGIELGWAWGQIDYAQGVEISGNVIWGRGDAGVVLDHHTNNVLVEGNELAFEPRLENPNHDPVCELGLEGVEFSDPVLDPPPVDPVAPQPPNGDFGEAFIFDGETTGVFVPAGAGSDLNLERDFTLSMWLKPSDVPSVYVTLLDKPVYGGDWPYARYSLYLVQGSTTVGFDLGVGEEQYQLWTTQEVDLAVWTHVAAVYDWSNVDDGNPDPVTRIYVNGVLDNELHLIGEAELQDLVITYDPADLDVPVGLGKYSFGGVPFSGSLDDVAIWDRVLNDAEIEDLFDGDLRPGPAPGPEPDPDPDPDLVLYLTLDEATISTNPVLDADDEPTGLELQAVAGFPGTGHDGLVNLTACPNLYEPQYLPGHYVWIHENATQITVQNNEFSGELDVPEDPISYEHFGPFAMIECHGSDNAFQGNTYPDYPDDPERAPPGFETDPDAEGIRIIGGYGHIRFGPRALHNTVSENELEDLPNACAQVLDVPEGYPVINAMVLDPYSDPPPDPNDPDTWVTLFYADYFNFSDAGGYAKDGDGRDIMTQARYFERVRDEDDEIYAYFGARSYDWWATFETPFFSLPATEELVPGFYPDDPQLYPDPGDPEDPATWGTPVTLPLPDATQPEYKNSIPDCQ